MNNAEVQFPPYINTKPLVIGKQVFHSVYDWKLTEKDLETARRELGESEEKKEACLQKLKEKLLNDASVKYRMDDSYLLRFLRVRKYDVPKVYQVMKNFNDLRRKKADFFSTSQTLMSNLFTFLPYLDEEGRAILLLNFKSWNPYEKTFEELFQTANSYLDVFLSNPTCQINGIVSVYDFDGFSLKQVSELLRKGRLMTYLSFIQNACPMRIKKGICINTNQSVRYIFSILKPLFQKKIRDRILLLGSDMNELHQHVNPVLLPKRLQGSLEEEECDASQFIIDNYPYLRYERSFSSK